MHASLLNVTSPSVVDLLAMPLETGNGPVNFPGSGLSGVRPFRFLGSLRLCFLMLQPPGVADFTASGIAAPLKQNIDFVFCLTGGGHN